MKKKILVAGGTGFLGYHLFKRIKEFKLLSLLIIIKKTKKL